MEEDAGMMSDEAASSSVSSASASSVASKALDLVIAAVKTVSWPFYLWSVLDVLDFWASCLCCFLEVLLICSLAASKFEDFRVESKPSVQKSSAEQKKKVDKCFPPEVGGYFKTMFQP